MAFLTVVLTALLTEKNKMFPILKIKKFGKPLKHTGTRQIAPSPKRITTHSKGIQVQQPESPLSSGLLKGWEKNSLRGIPGYLRV